MGVKEFIKKTFSKKPKKSEDSGLGIVTSGVPSSHFTTPWTKGQGITPIGKKAFTQYKIFYLTDPVINTNINMVARYIWKDGYKIKGGSDEDRKKIEDFFEDNNFISLGYLWVKDAKVFGTGYLEFPESKEKLILRSAETMEIETDKHGMIEKVIQKPTSDKRTWIPFEPEDVVIFKNNPFSDSVYGVSDLESVRYLISYMKDQAEEDMVICLNKYVGDRFKVKAGTAERPYNKKKLDELADFFEKLKPGEDVIFGGDIDVTGMGLEGQGPDIRAYLDYILMMLAQGTGVPAVFWIPQGSTEASARVSLRAFESGIVFYQKQIEDVINSQIIPQKIDADRDNMPKFEFNPINIDNLLLTARTDLIYSSQGIRTPNEIREERGFGDELEESPEEPDEEEPGNIDDNLPGDKTRGPEVGINKKLKDREIEGAI